METINNGLNLLDLLKTRHPLRNDLALTNPNSTHNKCQMEEDKCPNRWEKLAPAMLFKLRICSLPMASNQTI
jgi:hypothetical protein